MLTTTCFLLHWIKKIYLLTLIGNSYTCAISNNLCCIVLVSNELVKLSMITNFVATYKRPSNMIQQLTAITTEGGSTLFDVVNDE